MLWYNHEIKLLNFLANTLTLAGLPLSVFSGENPAKKRSCAMERNMQNPSHSRNKIRLHWGSLCCPIGDGDRAGCSPTETSSIQLLNKGGYAEIGTTSPAWMLT